MLNQVQSDIWVVHCHSEKWEFSLPPVWLRAQAETSLAQAARLMPRPQTEPRKGHRTRRNSDPHLPMRYRPEQVVLDVSPQLREVKEKWDRLEETLRREKRQSLNFEARLQQWMRDEREEEEEEEEEERVEESETMWDGASLEHGLELLRMKIRTARLVCHALSIDC